MISWCYHCQEYSYVNAKIGAIKICQFCGMAILPLNYNSRRKKLLTKKSINKKLINKKSINVKT